MWLCSESLCLFCFAVRHHLPRLPKGLLKVQLAFAAKKVNWERDFNLPRVERARAARSGCVVPEISDDPSPTRSELRWIMTGKPSFRAKMERDARRGRDDRVAPSRSGEAAAGVRCDPKSDGSRPRSTLIRGTKERRLLRLGPKIVQRPPARNAAQLWLLFLLRRVR